jgi:hypothetical protein
VTYVLSDLNREGSPLLSCVVERDFFIDYYQQLTGLTIDLDVCRYYNILYMMRSAAFWLSASGLFAEGKNKDLRLAHDVFRAGRAQHGGESTRILSIPEVEATPRLFLVT